MRSIILITILLTATSANAATKQEICAQTGQIVLPLLEALRDAGTGFALFRLRVESEADKSLLDDNRTKSLEAIQAATPELDRLLTMCSE